MNRKVYDAGPKKKARKQPKSYASGGSHSGIAKPCPTCYAPMELRQGNERTSWACAKHGPPAKP